MCTNSQGQRHQIVSSLVGHHLCNPRMCDSICTLSHLRVPHQVGVLPRQEVLFRWGGTPCGRFQASTSLALTFQRLDITWRTTFGEPARLLTSVRPSSSTCLTKKTNSVTGVNLSRPSRSTIRDTLIPSPARYTFRRAARFGRYGPPPGLTCFFYRLGSTVKTRFAISLSRTLQTAPVVPASLTNPLGVHCADRNSGQSGSWCTTAHRIERRPHHGGAE